MKNSLFFFLLFTNTIVAQMKQKEAYTVYINYPDYTVKANVLNGKQKIDVKETLTYYWCTSNKIIQTKGGYEGRILDGAYTSFYLSNNLKEKGVFKKGLKNGEWISWYDGGKISEITNWKNGLKSGSSKLFDTNEHLTAESNYKNGELNGAQTDYEDGKVVHTAKYKNGVEVVAKPKKEKVKKESKVEGAAGKPKKTVKEKIKSVFKKKDAKEPAVGKSAEKKKGTSPEKKPKKTFKEKFNSIFKKKKAPADPKKNNEPVKPAKQDKPQAAAK